MINDLDIVQWAYLLDPCFQLVNTAGKPLTEGYIEVYYHGTRTKYYCASDFDGTLHPFQIPLDSLGSNIVLASPSYAYDVYVYNKFGSLVMSRYNVTPGLGGGGGGIPGSDLPEHWLGTDGEAINIASDAVNVCLPLPVSGSVDYEGEFVDHFDETTLYLNEGMYIVEAVIQFRQSPWDLHNSLNNLKIDTGDGDSSYYWQEDVSGPESNQNVHERKVTFIRKVSGDEPYPFFISPSVGVQLNDVKIRRLNIVKLAAGGAGGGGAPMYKPGPGIAVDDEGVISVTGMQPVSGMNEYVTNITYNNDVTEIFNEIHNVTGDITNIYNEIQTVTGNVHEYTAGSGIIIEDDVISLDPDYVASGAVTQEQLEGATAVIENTIEGVSTTIINNVSGDISAVTSVLNDKIDAVSAAVPEAQVNADWNATEGKAEILNKPDLSVYATKEELQEVTSAIPTDVVSHDELQSVTSVIENTIEGVSTTIVETIEGATSVIENTIEGVSTTIVNEYTGDIESVTAVLNDKIDAVSAAVPESQVNADWNATEGKAEILNKPDLSVYATKDEVETVTGVLQDELMSVSTTVSGIIADQVQSDWDEDDTTDPAYIKNKPEEIPLVAGENIYIERVQDTLVISASSVDLSPYATNVDLAGATAQLEGEIQTVSGDLNDKIDAVSADIPDSEEVEFEELDLTDFASASAVAAIEADLQTVSSAIPDVSEFATRDEVSNATSVIENTIESVSTVIQNEISTVTGEIPDISNLATKDELESASGTLDAKIDAVSASIPDSEEVEFEELDVDALATNAELASATSVIENTIESVSTAIQNEIATVTGEIPDISNLATKDELESASGTLDAKIDAVSASIPEAQVQSDWTETATGDPAYIKNKPAEYDLVAGQNIEITTSGDDIIISADVPPVTGFATEEELQTVSSAIPDVSNLATKNEVQAVADDLQTVSSAIPDISDLATKDEVNTVAEYLEQDIQTVSSAIPDVSNLATKDELQTVSSAVDAVSGALPEEEEVEFEELDLSGYASIASVTAVEADIQTVSSAIPDVSGLATKNELETASGILGDKIDTVSGALPETQTLIAGANIEITESNNEVTISANVPPVTGFATEEDLQTVSAAIPDVSNLATKTELQTVSSAVDAVSGAIPELPAEEEVEFEELDLSGYASIASVTAVEADVQTVSAAIPDISDLATNTELQTVSGSLDAKIDAVSGAIPSAQVQSDWTETASGDPAYIKNKPESTTLVAGSGIVIVDSGSSLIISATGNGGGGQGDVTEQELATVSGILEADIQTVSAAIPEYPEVTPLIAGSGITISASGEAFVISAEGGSAVQVQSDWTETVSSDPAYIKNKPGVMDVGIKQLQAGDNVTITETANSIVISAVGGGAVTGYATEEELQTVSAAIPDTSNFVSKAEYDALFNIVYSLHGKTVDVIPSTGGTVEATPVSGFPGTVVTLSNTPDTNWAFVQYNISGATLSGNTFTLGESNVTVSGTFVDTSSNTEYRLVIETSYSSPDSGGQWYNFKINNTSVSNAGASPAVMGAYYYYNGNRNWSDASINDLIGSQPPSNSRNMSQTNTIELYVEGKITSISFQTSPYYEPSFNYTLKLYNDAGTLLWASSQQSNGKGQTKSFTVSY